MDHSEIKNILEAALLAAGRPLSLDQLVGLFGKGSVPELQTLKEVLGELALEYKDKGIELKEVGSGYRIQIRSSMGDWLAPLWEERAPRYSRALLETLSLIAYRQPITRGEIEEVRGVAVSTNIVRTMLERGWVRVVGHRDVPGKPAMFGTTKRFLDYFGLKKLDDLPPLSEIKDLEDLNVELALPESSPQSELLDELEEASQESIERAGAETELADERGDDIASLSYPEVS
ncbi:MAG: SMC-Scp complex subunit ScpB [Pseudomonadota bacterium]|jgi:segregation and condensation protein B|nr:SMC-Scp complex subunit ScpB [Pseudomonadota bacterium]